MSDVWPTDADLDELSTHLEQWCASGRAPPEIERLTNVQRLHLLRAMARKSKATLAEEARTGTSSVLKDFRSRAEAGEPIANLQAELDRQIAESGADPDAIRFQRKQLAEAGRMATRGTPWDDIDAKLAPAIDAYGNEEADTEPPSEPA